MVLQKYTKFLSVCLCLILCVHCLRISWIVLHIGIYGDETLFMSVGRGLLNGLHMWRDLFETKPPIVFWISELSLYFTNDHLLYRILTLLGCLGLTGMLTWKRGLVGFLFGYTLSLYALIRGGGYITELFALFPIVLGIHAFERKRYIVTGICIGILGLIKEPFVISMVLALLFLSKDRKIIIVILIAAITGFLLLLCTGLLADYVLIYLPEMFSGRIMPTLSYAGDRIYYANANIFLRGFYVLKLYKEFFIPLAFGFGGLGLSLILLMVAHVEKQPLAIVSVILSILLMNQIFVTEQVIQILGRVPWESSFFLWKMAQLFLTVPATVGSFLLLWKKQKIFFSTVEVVLLIYMSLFLAGIGSFLSAHFIFSFPFWIVLFLKVTEKNARMFWLFSILLLPFLYPLSSSVNDLLRGNQNVSQSQALIIDRVMDACHFERYMQFAGKMHDVVPFTHHSPYQIDYGITRSRKRVISGVMTKPNLLLEQKMDHDWEETKIVVSTIDTTENPVDIPEDFQQRFTEEIPKCAKDILKDRMGLRFYFRI